MLSSLILAWALSANPGLASYENLWRAKTGTVAPKTVDWSPIVRGISISSHILARLLIDDGEKRKGYFLSISPSLTPSFIIALTPSLSPFHLSRKHPNNTPFLAWSPFMPKSHYSSIFIYTWNPKYDKNSPLLSLSPPLSISFSLSHNLPLSLSLSFNDCALIEHSINVPAIERPSLSLSLSLSLSYPNL